MATFFAATFVSATLFFPCGSPIQPSRSGHHHEPQLVIVIGTISSGGGRCPTGSFEMTRIGDEAGPPLRVDVSPSTAIGGTGGCAGLAVGTRVEVEGSRGRSRMTAHRIAMIPD